MDIGEVMTGHCRIFHKREGGIINSIFFQIHKNVSIKVRPGRS